MIGIGSIRLKDHVYMSFAGGVEQPESSIPYSRTTIPDIDTVINESSQSVHVASPSQSIMNPSFSQTIMNPVFTQSYMEEPPAQRLSSSDHQDSAMNGVSQSIVNPTFSQTFGPSSTSQTTMNPSFNQSIVNSSKDASSTPSQSACPVPSSQTIMNPTFDQRIVNPSMNQRLPLSDPQEYGNGFNMGLVSIEEHRVLL